MVLSTCPYTNTLFVPCITSGAKAQQIAQGKQSMKTLKCIRYLHTNWESN